MIDRKQASSAPDFVVIGPESAEPFVRWWKEKKMPFPGIPDPKHDIANLYSQKFKLFKLGRMPALAVIDKETRVRFMHYANSMSDIPPDEQILDLLRQLKATDGEV